MAGLTADQIIERIANACGAEPAVMRQWIELALQNIIADTAQPHSFLLADLFSGGKPTVDELVVALEYELYDVMMPRFPGWEWDGEGYRNIRLLEKNGSQYNRYINILPGYSPEPQHRKSWQVVLACQYFYFRKKTRICSRFIFLLFFPGWVWYTERKTEVMLCRFGI